MIYLSLNQSNIDWLRKLSIFMNSVIYFWGDDGDNNDVMSHNFQNKCDQNTIAGLGLDECMLVRVMKMDIGGMKLVLGWVDDSLFKDLFLNGNLKMSKAVAFTHMLTKFRVVSNTFT